MSLDKEILKNELLTTVSELGTLKRHLEQDLDSTGLSKPTAKKIRKGITRLEKRVENICESLSEGDEQ